MGIFNSVLIPVIETMPKSVVKIFANKYIAGDNINDAVTTVRNLNKKGLMATVDVLGESITDKKEALISKDENIEALEAISKYDLDCNLSIKLTMLGLNIDQEFCMILVSEILEKAKSVNRFVRIDMEDSSVTESTINVFENSRKKYNDVGIVIQAYLRRSENDVKRLSQMGANFRICKGIYIEPEKIAFKDPDEIRNNFMKILRIALENKSYCGIATHDEILIKDSVKLVKELQLKNDEYEFQMLLGVRENLREEAVTKGHRMRIYVPFGKRWYEYSIRRFKENPNIAGQVLKSIFSGGK
ncbi:MAG TPA: proline dehydrogenase family protein [Ignavibacteria bacterium]|nr:proline dehydrogenase family protein [Ignavibacteria bacterium]HQY52811.1 proline dehydrogenase family protein [Ignavibacteria bacterium]HRA99872.1 proline dehydrogenase family protein [Ignavibacteria bacterium]